jgi:dCMP deaminase
VFFLGGCERCNAANESGIALDECLCLHAEENALLEAGRERAGAGEGGKLYCNTYDNIPPPLLSLLLLLLTVRSLFYSCPCLRCTVKIVQCGVKEVVYSLGYSMDRKAAQICAEAGVVLRQMRSLVRDV